MKNNVVIAKDLKTFNILGLAIGITFLAGCASEVPYIDLTYPPESTYATGSFSSFDSLLKGSNVGDVALEVYDKRVDKGEVADVRFSLASYATDENVSVLVHAAIEHELDQLTYRVIDRIDPSYAETPGILVVDVRLLHCDVFSTVYVEYRCNANIQATFETREREAITKSFPSEEVRAAGFTPTKRKINELLGQSLQVSIRTMLIDFGFARTDLSPSSSDE